MAEEAIRLLLLHEDWELRSFAIIKRHVGGFDDPQLRQLHVRAGALVVPGRGCRGVAPDAAEALFRVVDAAYQKRSIALMSNIHPAGLDELMPETLAAATVDRLLHHAHVLLTEGTESYRLAQATAGTGVSPLI